MEEKVRAGALTPTAGAAELARLADLDPSGGD
jgi:hypothetical protein